MGECLKVIVSPGEAEHGITLADSDLGSLIKGRRSLKKECVPRGEWMVTSENTEMQRS